MEYLTEMLDPWNVKEGDEIIIPGDVSSGPRLVFAVMDYGERCWARAHIAVRYMHGARIQGLWVRMGEKVIVVRRQETLSF